MNTKRIKELAEQAGISLSQKDYSYYWVESAEDIEKFAELIVAEEREACAKVCEDSINAIFEFSDEIVKETARNVCINLAKGIRARGNDA